ncbi:MAG: S41 family peptidase [Acidobacteriota bacterium]
MLNRTSGLRSLILVLVALVLGLVGGVVLDREVLSVFAQPQADSSQSVDIRLISEAWDVINRSYVDRPAVQGKLLTYGAIGGMMDALGDTGHSRFMTPEMVKQENNFTAGQFEGIGAFVQTKDGHAVIISPMSGSPAEKIGLKAGDIILAVDGNNVDGLPISQVIQKIQGPAGTLVLLTVQDPKTGEKRDLAIMRARITLHNLSWSMVPGTTIAHIRLDSFSQAVTQDLKNALEGAKRQGAKAIVLDLRNNPGGILDESVGVASQFLNSGDVLQEKGAQGQVIKVGVEPGGLAVDIPLVVLINNSTASAAEIVAGALQDARRARLVGETTFGTGTVLNQFGLSDGSALLLATQEWLTPDGRVIWHKGIGPDVPISLAANAAPLAPSSVQGMTWQELQASGDAQLLKALDLLGATGGNATP